MSLLDTAFRLASYKPQPFVAPIPTNGFVEIQTLQNGVPLRYKVNNFDIGWWELTPKDRFVRISRPARVNEIVDYLNALPRFYAIVTIPSGNKEWLVVPYNGSDASQRGWYRAEPRKMYMVSENLNPLDIVILRNLAGVFIYDSLDFRLGRMPTLDIDTITEETKMETRDWNNALNIIYQWQEKAKKEARKANLKKQLADKQNKIKFLLEFMGAKLVSSEKKGKGYQVTWVAPDGHVYVTGIQESGRVSVAGFCLDGTDSMHNLSSLVHVMEEAQRIGRPDIGHAYAEREDEDDED